MRLSRRLVTVIWRAGVVLAAVVCAVACTSQQPTSQPSRPTPQPSRQPVAHVRPAAGTLGVTGSYLVGEHLMTLVEPAHVGPTGERLGRRALLTVIRYPLARPQAGGQPASGRFPLLVFAPGFTQCAAPYSDLLQAWASAGYVVAAVNFPRTDCRVGAAAYEPDLVNQPDDMSFVISQLLALSAQPHNLFSGLLNSQEVAAAGQSDGGDTVAALAANTCCADHRLVATAVLSGAEWPPMPGRYFGQGAPPMLFVQGSADTINPPQTSKQLYDTDSPRARYYLDLLGADHGVPYIGTNPVERVVARVTLAFFDRYVLAQPSGLTGMQRAGNIARKVILVTGYRLPP